MCYKLLLGEHPSIADLELWQPEIAKSFQYIMSYEEEAPLEDILARSFTIDYEVFGEKQTIELVEGGKDKFVTKENREEFVALYVQHLFEKLCEQ
jgi:ubiquitin-protein ligase E3 A